MSWLNRLCIRQLQRAETIIAKRVALASASADAGFAEQELHAETLRRRLADTRRRIRERQAAELAQTSPGAGQHARGPTGPRGETLRNYLRQRGKGGGQ